MKRKVLFYSVARSDYDDAIKILENLDKTKIEDFFQNIKFF